MTAPRVRARDESDRLDDVDRAAGRRRYGLFVAGERVGTLHRRAKDSWNGGTHVGYQRWWEARPEDRLIGPALVTRGQHLACWGTAERVYFQGEGGIGQRTKAEAVALMARWLDENGWIDADGALVRTGPPMA